MLTSEIQNQITNADARALATTGPRGVNVVSVSVVAVTAEAIYLYDFFMGKTSENLQAESSVALAVWSGLVGVQVKATAEYVTTGDMFDAATTEMLERFPDRTLRGVIVLTPQTVYDISAGETAGTQLVGE